MYFVKTLISFAQFFSIFNTIAVQSFTCISHMATCLGPFLRVFCFLLPGAEGGKSKEKGSTSTMAGEYEEASKNRSLVESAKRDTPSTSSSESSNFSMNNLQKLLVDALLKSKCAFRSKRREIPSTSSSESSNFSLNDHPDLLIEVLLRLPTFHYALQCKCVCKNWYFLISSPHFVRRFITHHSNHHYNQNPSTLVIRYSISYYHSNQGDCRLLTIPDEPIFKSLGSEMINLLHDREKIGIIKVLAMDKDLMLCSQSRQDYILRSYVCNPYMKQFVALPLLQLESSMLLNRVGFVCEPYYFEDSQGECALNSNYRFRVFLIADLPKHYDVENPEFVFWMYCSKTQKWDRSVHGSEYRMETDVVAYNGKLLWYNGRSVFAYDPFNPELSTSIDCSYIESTKFFDGNSTYVVGVSQGFLRMMQLVGSGAPRSLVVWELKDYATMEWSLEYKVYLDTMITESSLVQEILSNSKSFLRLLGFHPNDKDVVYLYCHDFVISGNMMTSELNIFGELPRKRLFLRDGKVFNIELPLWPTPIRKLTKKICP